MRPLAFAPWLLIACHPAGMVIPDSTPEVDADTDADTDTDTDSDSDSDTDVLNLDADFDSGSVGSHTIEGGTVRLTPRSVTMANTGRIYAYWVHFRLSGVGDRAITLEVQQVEGNSFFGEQDHEVQLVYSCGGELWERMEEHSYLPHNGGTYVATHAFGCDPVTVATFFPFAYETMETWRDQVGEHPAVGQSTIGTSEQGRDIRMLTITNPELPTAGKHGVFILSRQHAAETAGSYQLTGLVDFLVSGQADAQPLLDELIWYVVPMVNPDGVYLGHSRSTSELRDPNRDWGNDESVEVMVVRSALEDLSASSGVDMVLDWHNQMNDVLWHDFVYSPSGNSFFPVLSYWTSFDNEQASGSSSCTAESCSSRSWAMEHVLYDPVFVLEPCPHDHRLTVEGLREQGQLTAMAVGEWFAGR